MRRRRACLAACSGMIVVGFLAAPLDPAAADTRPSGPPITVYFVNLDATSSTAPARHGVTAAVKHVNRMGGIAGRPLQLTECLTDQTPERGKACIDQAAAAKPTAVLAVQPGSAADHVPALSAAGVPFVAQTCNTNTMLSGSYTTFCFGSDFVGLYTAAANYLKSLGTVRRVVLPYINVPAAATGVRAYADPIMQRAGIVPIDVPIPEGTVDISAAVAPAFQGNPDALVGLLTGPGCISAMKVKADIASTKPFVLPAMCTDPDVLADAGSGAKGTLFVRQTVAFDNASPDVKTYRRAMSRYSEHANPDDVYTQAGFGVVMNLATAMRTIPTGTPIDSASTTAALRAAKGLPLFLGGGSTFSCDGSAYPGLKALCSLQAHVVEYQGRNRWVDKGVF